MGKCEAVDIYGATIRLPWAKARKTDRAKTLARALKRAPKLADKLILDQGSPLERYCLACEAAYILHVLVDEIRAREQVL